MIEKYNVGDIIELSPNASAYGQTLKSSFQVEIIGKKVEFIFVLLPRHLGVKIDYERAIKYNIDTKHIGRYGYHFLPHEITCKIKDGSISLSLKPDIECWKQFVYGRQIELERNSSLPSTKRAFEFL